MSRPELYAVASFLSAVGVAGYYLIVMFDLPGSLEGFGDQLGSILIRTLVLAFALQFVLDLAQSIGKFKIDKDERDRLIEGKAFRNAYYVLTVFVSTAIVHLVVSAILGAHIDDRLLVSMPVVTLHILVLGVLSASMMNAISRLYLYRQGV